MATMQRRIYCEWFAPSSDAKKIAKVRFKIHSNGRLSDLRLYNTKEDSFSISAIKAIKGAAPFFPLPKGAPESVEIEFTFDSSQYSKAKKYRDWQPDY